MRTLVDEAKDPGYHTAYWDGKTDSGKEVLSSIYFYQISIRPQTFGEEGGYKVTKKLVRVK